MSLAIFAESLDCLSYGLAFIGAFSWGLYSALSSKGGEESGGGDVVKYFQMAYLLGLPLLFYLPISPTTSLTLPVSFLFLINISLNFLAFLSWDFGMRRENVVILSLGADFIPWISLLAISLIHGVKIGASTITSAVVLVIGAMVTRYGTRAKPCP